MNPRLYALDDAFAIVQGLNFRNDSMIAIAILTRVEIYLVIAARAEVKAMMEAQ